MKCIYWNARGLANNPSRLALKNIITQYHPDFIFISEPWMDFENFPRRWLSSLNLKLFAVNSRINLSPNLWCICKPHFNPHILAIDNQHITFSLTDNNQSFALSVIYASTNYLVRRQLWNSLNTLQSHLDLPWCFIGDFNSIIGAHEHRGRVNPARLPMEEFRSWSDSHNLLHIPTRGADYTWYNGRDGRNDTERRLDRAICNQAWFDLFTSTSVTTLVKHKSDHSPLLLDFQLTFCFQF
jgi:hypothetical protein